MDISPKIHSRHGLMSAFILLRTCIRICACICACTCICCGLLCGCSSKVLDDEKIRDMDFTVVPKEDIPKELMEIIDESKETLFKKTYSDKENLYIVIGYGAQPTTGYSIKVNEFYESRNAIYLKTWLVGPSKTEQVSNNVTYPYIVLKIEDTDKKIVFR